MKCFKIFLSGSVQKQFKELNMGKTYWKTEDEEYLRNNLNFPVKLLNPNTITIDKSDTEGRFKEDLTMVLESDLIFVDAKDKKGIGIGSEMILAKMYKIPIYTICPLNSHYRKKISTEQEWIHPFLYELSDKIFESKEEMVLYLNRLYKMGKIQNRTEIDVIDVIDRLNGYDGGYDEGYTTTEQFWGNKSAKFVQEAADMLKQQNINNAVCLDLGCGHGKNAIYLAEKGFKVTGIDVSYYSIKEARKLSSLVEWKVRDMKKIKCEEDKYDLVILTGSLHCLSTIDEVINVVGNVKLSTKIGGYNVISVFNNEIQDLSGHSSKFKPLLLGHDEYVDLYKDWKIIENSNTVLEDEHPHNKIKHRHSITRLLVQRMQ